MEQTHLPLGKLPAGPEMIGLRQARRPLWALGWFGRTAIVLCLLLVSEVGGAGSASADAREAFRQPPAFDVECTQAERDFVLPPEDIAIGDGPFKNQLGMTSLLRVDVTAGPLGRLQDAREIGGATTVVDHSITPRAAQSRNRIGCEGCLSFDAQHDALVGQTWPNDHGPFDLDFAGGGRPAIEEREIEVEALGAVAGNGGVNQLDDGARLILSQLLLLTERPHDHRNPDRAHDKAGNAEKQNAQRPSRHVLLGNEIVLGLLLLAAGGYLTREAGKLIDEGREGFASAVSLTFGPIGLVFGYIILLVGLFGLIPA